MFCNGHLNFIMILLILLSSVFARILQNPHKWLHPPKISESSISHVNSIHLIWEPATNTGFEYSTEVVKCKFDISVITHEWKLLPSYGSEGQIKNILS